MTYQRVDTLALASLTTGRMLTQDHGALYDTVEAILGWRPFTNQLDPAMREIESYVKEALPGFPDSTLHDTGAQSREGWAVFGLKLVSQWGQSIELPPKLEPNAVPPLDHGIPESASVTLVEFVGGDDANS